MALALGLGLAPSPSLALALALALDLVMANIVLLWLTLQSTTLIQCTTRLLCRIASSRPWTLLPLMAASATKRSKKGLAASSTTQSLTTFTMATTHLRSGTTASRVARAGSTWSTWPTLVATPTPRRRQRNCSSMGHVGTPTSVSFHSGKRARRASSKRWARCTTTPWRWTGPALPLGLTLAPARHLASAQGNVHRRDLFSKLALVGFEEFLQQDSLNVIHTLEWKSNWIQFFWCIKIFKAKVKKLICIKA